MPLYGRMARTSNTTQQGGTGGTLGGIPRASGGRPGMKLALGDEMYLWLLVLIEVFVMGWLRQNFRRHHGG